MPVVTTNLTEQISSASVLGCAKEATFGTVTTPTNFVPFTGVTINPDPGLFYPVTIQGTRDANIYPMYGQTKLSGNIDAPLYPVNGIPLFVGCLGSDAGFATLNGGVATTLGLGITGQAVGTTNVPVSTTSVTSTAAAATTMTVVSGGASFTVGMVAVIDSGTAIAETVVIASSTATSITFTATPLANAHDGTTTPVTVAKAGWVSAGSVAVNATTITLTTGGGASFASGDYVQIDVNAAGVTSSEVHKITVASDTITLADTGLPAWITTFNMQFAHASGVQVVKVKSPTTTSATGLFTHQIVQTNFLSSFTVEKNIGGFQSEQYYGCRVSKYALKSPATNTAVSYTADIMAQKARVLTTPTARTVDAAVPFMFLELNFTFAWQDTPTTLNLMNQATNLTLDIDNGVKDTYTFNTLGTPQLLTPGLRKVTGTMTAVFNSLNDTQMGWFSRMLPPSLGGGFSGALSMTWAHTGSTTPGSLTVNIPQVNISKYADEIKMGDIVLVNLSYEAAFNFALGQTLSAVVKNSQYLPIG